MFGAFIILSTTDNGFIQTGFNGTISNFSVFDCAMQAAVHIAASAGISKVHAIKSKVEKHAQLESEIRGEYAAQCYLIREIFDYPIDPKLLDYHN